MAGADKPLDMGKWKGLFEFAMKFQDGSSAGGAGPPLDPEKKAWLEHALQDFMKDFADRMREITTSLGAAAEGGEAQGRGATLAEKEALCDELMEIVENVDYARDLHKIGGLPTLLSLLASPHPSLRWRAAEIAATCMANNPPVQRWFMEGGALPPLVTLLGDPHPVVATKALLGLSALVRHYDPGLEAFRLAGGLNKLLALLGCNTDSSVAASAPTQQPQQEQQTADQQQEQQQRRRRLLRKVLALVKYVLAKHPMDGAAAAELGAVPRLAALLADSDPDMRAASLAVLVEILGHPQGWHWAKQHEPGLLGQLQQLQQQQRTGAAGEEDEDDEEERQLLQRAVALLAGPSPPQGSAQGLQDHIDLDPHQDGPERNAPHTIAVGGAGQQHSSSMQGGGALMALPKQELR